VGLVYANGEKNEANQVNEHSMVKNPKMARGGPVGN